MSYLYLLTAIIFEITGTICMKMSNSFTVLLPSIGMVVFYILCFFFLSLSLKTIEVGIAYATWSAVGLSLIAIIGVVFFNESLNLQKVLSLALIVTGVIGLNLSGIKH